MYASGTGRSIENALISGIRVSSRVARGQTIAGVQEAFGDQHEHKKYEQSDEQVVDEAGAEAEQLRAARELSDAPRAVGVGHLVEQVAATTRKPLMLSVSSVSWERREARGGGGPAEAAVRVGERALGLCDVRGRVAVANELEAHGTCERRALREISGGSARERELDAAAARTAQRDGGRRAA